jgi:steroid delta-isomerase
MNAASRVTLATLIAGYEALSADSVDALVDCYAANARFKDPFNDVQGRPAIAHIFRHMFQQVESPRFVVTAQFAGEGGQSGAMLLWEFHFRTRGWHAQNLCVRGATHLEFDASGKVSLHRDYWDVAEELYAKLPLLGALMRRLQQAGRA